MYFIYKAIKNNYGGGVIPKVDDSVFTLGLANRGPFYLGKVTDVTKIYDIKDYFVIFIDDDTAAGFKLLGVTQLPKDPANPDSGMRDLTDVELAQQKKAEILMAKLDVRSQVDASVDDIADNLADLSKVVEVLTDLTFKMANTLLQNKTFDSTSEVVVEYLPIVQNYVQKMNSGDLNLLVNLFNKSDLMNKLYQKDDKLVQVMAPYYKSKV